MSHYDVLGVAPTADEATVRRAYLALARQHHPDRAGGDAARMRAINVAWAALGDPERRAAYDRLLQGAPAATAAPTRPPRPWVEEDWEDWELGQDDIAADLRDERPIRVTVRMPRWLSLLPAALLAAATGIFVVSVVFSSEPLFALAIMTAVLSGLFFVSAPFIALLATRRRHGPGEE